MAGWKRTSSISWGVSRGGPSAPVAAKLAGAVAADDSGEGPRPDLLGRELAFGHAASPLWLWAVMRAAACTLTRPIGKRAPATGNGAQPRSEEHTSELQS